MSKEIIPSPGGSNKFSRLISKIKAALGIVEESNTATHSIAAGKYVTWKGDLYKAKSAISSGATLSSSNLEAVSEGGLNALNEQIGTLVAMSVDTFSVTVGANTSVNYGLKTITKSGYTALMLNIEPTSYGDLAIFNYEGITLSNGQAKVNGYVHNNTSAERTIIFNIRVLWVKNV